MTTEEKVRKNPLRVAEPQMVDAEEYCRLAISSRHLERCDDPTLGLRRLRDVRTGEVYAIEDARLAKHRLSP